MSIPVETITIAASFTGGVTSPVNITSGNYKLGIGKIFTLTPTISPSDATNQTLSWTSSNSSKVTVDSTGLVTGIAAGTATITATANDGSNITADFEITVQAAVTAINFTLDSNNRVVIPSTNLPASVPFTLTGGANVPLIWSSPHGISFDSSTGAISLVDSSFRGEVTIDVYSTDGYLSGSLTSATTNVYISNVIESISFTTAEKFIGLSSTYVQSPNLLPTAATGATNLLWESSDEAVATVNSTGTVTGLAVGTTTISVTADDTGGAVAEYTVTVGNYVTSITVNPLTTEITHPNTFTPTSVTIEPTNATNPTFTWSSGDTAVATVNETTGEITSVSAGIVTITATANDASKVTGTITVTVIRLIENIEFLVESHTIHVGENYTPQYNIIPESASNKNLSWSSSNETIATVNSSTGQITGVSESATEITITATTTDGTNISAGIQITVEAAPISNICFVAGTPVNTDQGPIPIEQLDHNTNTINCQPIVAISKIVSSDSHLIFLKANCLGPNQPSQNTTVSKLHKILYNGIMYPALNLPNVEQMPYDGQPLYNVLLENYGTMTVNNLTVETLHPRSNIAVLYKYIATNNIGTVEKNKLIGLLNNKLDKTNNLRKAFFSNIVTVIMLNLLTEPKEEHVEVTQYSIINAFLPNAALISKSNPLF